MSTMACRFLIFLFVVQAVLFVGVHSGFLIEPSSMTATVNSTVNFTCLFDSPATYGWIFNGRLLNLLSPRHGISFSTDSKGVQIMTVFCNESRHRSRVVCRVTLDADDTVIRSDAARLLIQGRLGKVTALVVESSNAESITISWTPPFSLDITGVDPDFTHTVRVYKNETGELLNKTTNIANSSFTYSPENPDPSVLLEFFIVAVDPRGQEGEPSDPVQGYFLGDPIPIPAKDVEVGFISSVFISFPAHTLSTAYGRRPTSYVVFALSTDDSSPDCVCSDVTEGISDGVATLEILGDCGGCLSLDIVYNITIQTVNEVGRSNSTGAITLDLSQPLTTAQTESPTPTGSVVSESSGGSVAVYVVAFGSAVVACVIIGIVVFITVYCSRKKVNSETDDVKKSKQFVLSYHAHCDCVSSHCCIL